MAYDLEEQEQLDEFKVWWKKYGKLAINLVLAALVPTRLGKAINIFSKKKQLKPRFCTKLW